MVDLSVNFAGIELKNPLVVASSDTVRTISQVKKAEECGASAVILKAMFPDDSSELNSILRIFVDEKGQTVYGAAGTSRLGYTQGLELVRAAKRETSLKIGVCIPFFSSEHRDVVSDAAKRAAKAGADFIEVNLRMQIAAYRSIMEGIAGDAVDAGGEAEKIGEHLRDVLTQTLEGVRLIKQSVNIPVIAKLVPDGVDVLPLALAAQRAGADALDAIGSLSGAFRVDIHDGGRTRIPCARTAVFQLSGAMLKPYSQGAVARILKTLGIPVMGTGGLMTWTDVVEMIMFGATTVSFCALLMIRGFEALGGIEKKLRKYMEQQGYRRIDDFRGACAEIHRTVNGCVYGYPFRRENR